MKSDAVRALLFVGVLYCVAGIVFGGLAGRAGSHQMVVAWRWAAWAVSAVAFGAHIIYEQVRLRSPSRITAFRVASAAGLGAFGLAVAANVHTLTTPAQRTSLMLGLSLAIWPIITALPAFVVAWISAKLLERVRSKV
jgi:hypothetical protein